MATKIEWTDKTWNPVVGCKKISPGCDHCYAERMANRLAGMGKSNYLEVIDYHQGGWNGNVWTCTQRHWDNIPKSGRCFVGSMSDLFYEEVPLRFIDEVYSELLTHHRATYQILTKRPQRALEYYQSAIVDAEEHDGLPCPIVNAPNIWFGATAENQECLDWRARDLIQIPAIVRFFSLEPLLGPITLKFHLGFAPKHEDLRSQFHWVIVGPETGPGRRPCELEWIDSIVAQCHAADVPIFVKAIHIADGRGGTRVVKDINQISNQLAMAPEKLRQWPDDRRRQGRRWRKATRQSAITNNP